MRGADTIQNRREFLLGGACALSASAGCLNRLRRTRDRDEPSPVSVQISTLPNDEDLYGIRIANHLAENLRQAGISVDVVPRRYETFLRRVLINQDYDIYVWRLENQSDPDFLRALLHSRFAEEAGWQNPFGHTDESVDELLEAQVSQTGEERLRTFRDIQEQIHSTRPLIPIAFEEDRRLSRGDRITVSEQAHVRSAPWLLSLTSADDAENGVEECELGTTDWRMTQNLNPLAVEYRGGNGLIELLYQPLMYDWGGSLIPWLATDIEWESDDVNLGDVLIVNLRDDLVWHDSEPLTATDVVFTYDFMTDTTMDDEDPTIPTPRYRGRTSLVESVARVSQNQVRFTFDGIKKSLAEQSLTVPILPRHEWEEYTSLTDIAGVTIADSTTTALVRDNLEPIGSGPFEVTDVSTDDDLELSKFDDHFLWNGDGHALQIDQEFLDFESIRIDIRPSVTNIASSINDQGLDGAFRSLGASVEVERDETKETVEQTSTLYHIGFNLRKYPLMSQPFRRTIAQFIDRQYIYDEVFGNTGVPVLSPVYDTAFVPTSLRWDPDSRDDFVGEPGDGKVDEEVAKDMLREAGFQYSADGELLGR